MNLNELAQLCGVSAATVSNVLNGKGKVSQSRREEISRLLRENDYDPITPEALSRKKSHRRIRLFCAELDILRTDLFTNALLEGVLSEALRSGYDVAVTPVEKDESGRYQAHFKPELDADGLIIVNPRENEDYLELIRRAALPYVVVGRPNAPRVQVNYVDVDNEALIYNAASYLIGQEHRNILLLTGPEDYTNSADHAEGFRKALRAHDIRLDESLVRACDYSIQAAGEAMSKTLESNEPITAVIACSDLLTLGALQAIESAGLCVPKNVSLLCASETLLTITHPCITGYDINIPLMGRRAARMVIDIIERRLIKPTHIHIPFVLNERDTVTPPAQRHRAFAL